MLVFVLLSDNICVSVQSLDFAIIFFIVACFVSVDAHVRISVQLFRLVIYR